MMQRDDLIAHYSLLATEYSAWYLSDGARVVLKQSTAFLNEMLPMVDTKTDDSVHLVEMIMMGHSEDKIRWVLSAMDNLGGIPFFEAKRFMLSFEQYIGKGLMRKPKRVMSAPQKYRALYQVLDALIYASDDGPIKATDGGCLDWTQASDGIVAYITDANLIALVVDHAGYADDIAAYIKREKNAHLPSLEHIVQGGAKAVASGAL